MCTDKVLSRDEKNETLTDVDKQPFFNATFHWQAMESKSAFQQETWQLIIKRGQQDGHHKATYALGSKPPITTLFVHVYTTIHHSLTSFGVKLMHSKLASIKI